MSETDAIVGEEDWRCRRARQVMRSASAGLRFLSEERPEGYLQDFCAIGLLVQIRSIWDAAIGDHGWSKHHKAVISPVIAKGKPLPASLERFNHLLRPARNYLVHEFNVWPVGYGTGDEHDYGIAIHIPKSDERAQVLTQTEAEDARIAAQIARALGYGEEEASSIENSIRIDVLPECRAALQAWDYVLTSLEIVIQARLIK